MSLNNFTLAVRSLFRYKTHSGINIFGLSFGIAFAVMVFLYAMDEFSYDKWNKKADKIFRLVEVTDFSGVGEEAVSCPFPVAPALQSDFNGMIEQTVRIFNFQNPFQYISVGEKIFKEPAIYLADSNIFEMFDYKIIAGDASTPLMCPATIVLTSTLAKKYFGNENPIGKTLKLNSFLNITVTAVMQDVPEQSHFTPDALISLSTVRQLFRNKSYPKTWVWNPCWTYILLKNQDLKNDIEAAFPEFIKKYFFDAANKNIRLYLQPLTDIHLKSNLDYEINPNNNYHYLIILISIAVFILIIAAINFINLSTAIAANRIREINVKKIYGATRGRLIGQFYLEAFIVVFISLFISVDLAIGFKGYFGELAGKSFDVSMFFQPEIVLLFILLWLIISLASGTVPAFYLSNLTLTAPLKIKSGNLRGGLKIRKMLVLIQFTISVFLIITTYMVYKQSEYLQMADIGLDKKNIIIFQVDNTPICQKYDAFRKELMQHPGVVSITASDDIPGISHNTWDFHHDGIEPGQWVYYPALAIRHGFVKTYGINIVAGRDFDPACPTDSVEAILINEAMVNYLGYKSNEEALGKMLKTRFGNEKITGIFKNFNGTSLHGNYTPFALDIKERNADILFLTRYFAVKYDTPDTAELLGFIKEKWNLFCPGYEFEYSFYADRLAQQYKDEKILSRFTSMLSVIIVIIALIGLYGLTSYYIIQHYHEIAVRKVLGAGHWSLLVQFIKNYLKLVLLANLVAAPLAYIFIKQWLQNFAFHIPPDAWAWLAGFFISVISAVFITGLRVYVAMMQNPTKILHYE